MPSLYGLDAFSPAQIAERVTEVGVAKARLPLLPLVMLGVLAGAFIGLGALFAMIVFSDVALDFATRRVLGGLVFSLGLGLVVVAGAELFTGNNLIAMAWAEGKVSTREMARNWLVVCAANFAGAAGLAVLVYLSGHLDMNGGAIGQAYAQAATAKASLPPLRAFFSGVLCNILVCMAVWMSLAGRSVADKLAAIVLPIAAFVAAGFEHSVANMYLIPLGLAQAGPAADWWGLARNLVPVIAGNIVGGSVLVALVYRAIYLRPRAE
jgi:formate/nitrite transporter